MAPLEHGGVVDTRLKVYGVDGLRVVDAGIMPTISSGHTVSDPNLHFGSVLLTFDSFVFTGRGSVSDRGEGSGVDTS